MIAKAKAISHGINGIRYITGVSHNKKHPEKIHRIMDNLLPSHLDAMGIWNSMLFTLSAYKNMKNSVIRIELSPSPEHTKYFNPADWKESFDALHDAYHKFLTEEMGLDADLIHDFEVAPEDRAH